MPQKTRKSRFSDIRAGRSIGSVTPLGPRGDLRSVLQQMAEKAGSTSMKAARKTIQQEIRAALGGGRADLKKTAELGAPTKSGAGAQRRARQDRERRTS